MSAESIEMLNLSEMMNLVFNDLIKNKEQQREIDELLFQKHNIFHGTLNELLVEPEKFSSLGQIEQGAIANTIYEVTKDDRIQIQNFFNSRELNKIKKFKKENKSELSFPHTFGNFVIRTTENDFNTSLTYKEVVDLWNSQLLQWNPDIQRKPKEKINAKGELIRKPKVNQTSVKQITDLMLKGRFRSNQITFCILMDGSEKFTYDDGELTIEAGNMYIIDGLHRLSGMINTLEQNPDYQGFVDVAIKYLTYDDARYYLGQINKMSKFDKTFVKALMNDEISDKIVYELDKKSALRGRITTDTTVSKKKTYLTNFAILSKGIEDIFEPKDNVDRINISEVLINFFDYLLDYYPDDFSRDLNKLIEARNKSLRNYHNTFVVYLVIAKKLFDKYGKNIPSDEIIRIVENFDFSKDGEYAQVLFGEGSGKVNSNQVKRNIKKYAEEKIDKLFS